MRWLDTITDLSFLLQQLRCNWICFFTYETGHALRHSSARDYSVTQTMPPDATSQSNEPVVRCFFARDPTVNSCDSSAEQFFENDKVRSLKRGGFLIPYYSQSRFSCDSQYPFLSFEYGTWFEFSGHPDADFPTFRSSGVSLEDLLGDVIGRQSHCTDVNQLSPVDQVPSTHCESPNESWKSSESAEALLHMFERLKARMRDGHCYLANGTTRMCGPERQAQEFTLAEFVTQWVREPSRYGVFVDCGDNWPRVVCFSPERFLQRSGRLLQTEPIKGTACVQPQKVDFGAEQLWSSGKEMCEQKMVTDLLRNDLNKVSVPGSVIVASPYEVRVAGSLLQMQSIICGTLASSAQPNSEILCRTLPAGSVTGTPKYAVGQLIAEVEHSPRGYYTGVFVQCEDEDCFDSTILIRGFFADSERWYAGVGAGITTLSDSAAEVVEFDLKWRSFSTRMLGSRSSIPYAARAGFHGFSRNFLEECSRRIRDVLLPSKSNQSHSNAGATAVGARDSQAVQTDSFECQASLAPEAPLFELHDLDELIGFRGVEKTCLLFVDHYDSFSDSLIAGLRSRGLAIARIFSPSSDISTAAGDFLSGRMEELESVLRTNFQGILFSPGPHCPADYQFSQQLLSQAPEHIPMLGVCLGHQLFLTAAGMNLCRVSQNPIHGRGVELMQIRPLHWLAPKVWAVESAFYNSWQVQLKDLEQQRGPWLACGEANGGVAICEHELLPRIGVQFHPESFASVAGGALLDAFVDLVERCKINSLSISEFANSREGKIDP